MTVQVLKQSYTLLRRWSIICVMDGDEHLGYDCYHLIGQNSAYSPEMNVGWLRSPQIKHINLTWMTAQTALGNAYVLVGEAAAEDDEVAMEAIAQAVELLGVDPLDVDRVEAAEVALALARLEDQRGWRM